jgi:DNA-binding response OmpR family regulator
MDRTFGIDLTRGDRPLLRASGLEVDLVRCQARVDSGPFQMLTATEFALLNCLLLHAGNVVSHQELCRQFNTSELSVVEAATLCKHHIRSLRGKLEPDPREPRFILSVRGRGYTVPGRQ